MTARATTLPSRRQDMRRFRDRLEAHIFEDRQAAAQRDGIAR